MVREKHRLVRWPSRIGRVDLWMGEFRSRAASIHGSALGGSIRNRHRGIRVEDNRRVSAEAVGDVTVDGFCVHGRAAECAKFQLIVVLNPEGAPNAAPGWNGAKIRLAAASEDSNAAQRLRGTVPDDDRVTGFNLQDT